MYRAIIGALIVLCLIYYVMVMGQFLAGLIKFTNRRLTFWRALVPFYFWIAPVNERSK